MEFVPMCQKPYVKWTEDLKSLTLPCSGQHTMRSYPGELDTYILHFYLRGGHSSGQCQRDSAYMQVNLWSMSFAAALNGYERRHSLVVSRPTYYHASSVVHLTSLIGAIVNRLSKTFLWVYHTRLTTMCLISRLVPPSAVITKLPLRHP